MNKKDLIVPLIALVVGTTGVCLSEKSESYENRGTITINVTPVENYLLHSEPKDDSEKVDSEPKKNNEIKIPESEFSSCGIASVGTAEMRALLDTIGWAEGTRENYNKMYGRELFADMSAHPVETGEMPREGIRRWGVNSTAAGRYQFLHRTYQGLVERGNFTDGFIPEEQDRAAINLIERRRVNQTMLERAVRSEHLGEVRAQLDRTWTSFQSNSEEALNNVFLDCYRVQQQIKPRTNHYHRRKNQ